MTKNMLMLLVMFALVAAACADSESDPSAEELPTAPPGALAACIESDPDCNDTVQIEPGDTPPPGDEAGQSLPDAADLTVSEALEADGFAAVTGLLFDDGSGWVLCEALAESFPPQCPGPRLPVTNYKVDPNDVQESQGIRWTDVGVAIYGELTDGTLVGAEISE